MIQKPDIIIAIDPDCDKSGVAELDTRTRRMLLSCRTFPELMDYLHLKAKESSAHDYRLLVVVEAGWLNQAHWHLTAKDTARLAAAKGNSTGRNHEVARKIAEMSRHFGLETKEVKPLRKCWSGKDGKITHEELEQFIDGLPLRTNQEMRDSALLAWNEAGFPIRINRKEKGI